MQLTSGQDLVVTLIRHHTHSGISLLRTASVGNVGNGCFVGKVLDVDLKMSDFALNSPLVRGEALHDASAPVQDYSFPRARNPAEDHSYILDAYLLLQLGQAHLLRRWMKQTFAASCSNGSICHKGRLTTTARMARLRVTVPIAVRHPFHIFQVLVAIRRYSWASASKVGLQAPDNPCYIHFRPLF